ncbi:hypothetical protein [Synechococcus sp. R5-12]|uniref:hypothetical protein n=1 Tax=Synechococcus sp. R5-12 TaxID=2421321 RepID=UPI0039C61538
MNFKGRSLAVLCGVLLLGGCGEVNESPTLPGPVQVDPAAFVSAQEYRFTPGSVLETTSLRLDFINPRFGGGVSIPVRSSPNQGSGEARLQGIEAIIAPTDDNRIAIRIAERVPPLEVVAFAPNNARLSTRVDLSTANGLALISSGVGDRRLRVNTAFSGEIGITQLRERVSAASTTLLPDGSLTRTELREEVPEFIRTGRITLQVTRILVSRSGNQVVLEGQASLTERVPGVLNEVTGEFFGSSDLRQSNVDVILQQGSFSASFVVRQRGVAGDGTPEDALALFARLNFRPNQAEIVYRPAQVGTQSVLFAPDPTRPNILPNQLVRIRRLLNGRVQAEFDPANTSTVLNFVQVSPPPRPFPTPIPQLPVPDRPGAPTVFDYFFSLRTERSTGTLPGSPVEGSNPEPVILQGIVPTTGDFVFRTLAGAQLAGPFNRLDIGGGTQRGNLNLVFDSTTSAERISGQWFLEQEFPTGNVERGTADEPGNDPSKEGAILIIRGFFEGTEVRL